MADGSAEVKYVLGYGKEPFIYLWSTGATTQNIKSLMPGSYWVKVTDANLSLIHI